MSIFRSPLHLLFSIQWVIADFTTASKKYWQSRNAKDEPARQISRSEAIYFKSYYPDTHTNTADQLLYLATKVINKD